MFLPHFDAVTVISYWTDAHQHGISLFYIITEQTTAEKKNSFYFKISKAGVCPLWRTRKKAIWRDHYLYKVKQSHWLLTWQRIVIGPRKSNRCQTWLERCFSKAELKCCIYQHSTRLSWKIWTLPWLLCLITISRFIRTLNCSLLGLNSKDEEMFSKTWTWRQFGMLALINCTLHVKQQEKTRVSKCCNV